MNNRGHFFFDKLGNFSRLEKLGFDSVENSGYSPDYALWKILQNRQCGGYKFDRQQKVMNCSVSYYCEEAKLVVDFLHTEHPIRKKEDEKIDQLLKQAGISVLRFHPTIILERPASVKNSILEELPPQDTPE